MSNEVRCWCQHCGTELPLSHSGKCPTCHKTGKRFVVNAEATVAIKTTGAVTTINRSQIKQIDMLLDKSEKTIWDKVIDALKNTVIIDGFEVGFPSGVTIVFKIKNKK